MTFTPFYKILPGSAGSFMDPPGHPHHTQHLEGFETTRHRNPLYHGALDYALADDFDGSDGIKDRVRRIFADAKLVESELWVRNVYGYFRNSYLPEGKEWGNASDLVTHNLPEIARDRTAAVLDQLSTQIQERAAARAEVARAGGSVPEGPNPLNYRRGVAPIYGRRRGWEITTKWDGSEVFVYALADDGTQYDAAHLGAYAEALAGDDEFTEVTVEPMTDDHAGRVRAKLTHPPQPMPVDRHAAVLHIRKYFPDHKPRLELIEDPGKGYGSWPCTKCGQRVQYEAKVDALSTFHPKWGGSAVCQTDQGAHTWE